MRSQKLLRYEVKNMNFREKLGEKFENLNGIKLKSNFFENKEKIFEESLKVQRKLQLNILAL